MSCSKLRWALNLKPVYNKITGIIEMMQFLRLNTIHDYNMNMGGVDLADQLRLQYQMDTWIRNRKWWWSIMFWSIGLILTNAYVVYVNASLVYFNKQRKDLISHHDFLKAIALHWISGSTHQDAVAGSFLQYAQSVNTEVSLITNLSLPSAKKLKGTRVNDAALDPKNGSLKHRLYSNLDHLPEESSSQRPRCALHRWSGGGVDLAADVRANVVYCATCNINLCVKCYQTFHTISDIKRCKQSILNS